MSRMHRRELVSGDYPQLEAVFTDQVHGLRLADALAPLIVLVPSNLLRLHLSRLLVERGTAHLNIHFITFADLVRPYGKRMPAQAGELLVARACQDSSEDFYFEGLRDSPGLYRAIAGSINDLKEATLTPDRFAKLLRSAAGLSGTARRKLSSVLEVWRQYESARESHNLRDEVDLHRQVVEHAGRHPLFHGTQAFIVYGIYDFKPIQFQVLLALAANLDTTVYFPFEPSPAFEYAGPSREDLVAAGFAERPAWRSDAADRPFRLPDGVEIISCPSESAEASEICRTVLSLARSQDVRLCDVAVLGRSPAALHGSLREGFESLGARPFDLAGRPLSQTRAGHTLVLLLQVIQDDYARRTLMELLSVADIDWPGVGVSQSAASFWDSLSMRAGIVQGRQQWLGRLRSLRSRLAGNRGGNDRHAPANQTEKLAALDALIDTVESLLSRLERIRQSKDWGQMVRHVAGTYEWLVHSSPASEAVMAITRGLAQLGPLVGECDLGLFARLASESLDAASTAAGDFQRQGPALAGIMQARGVPFPVVVVPGLVERMFPLPPSQDPILLDDERRAINAAIARSQAGPWVPRLPEKRRQVDEERLLFRLATGAAAQRLILTYTRLEAETARERIPSQFLLDIVESLTGRPADYAALASQQRRVALRDHLPEPQRAASRLEFDLASARRALSGERGMLLAWCNGDLSRHFARALHAESQRWSQTALTAFDGLISDPSLLAKLRRRSPLETVISPSRLEDYADCPFHFFMHYVLDLEPVEDPEALTRSDPIGKGKMVHAVLEEFLRKMIDEQRTPIGLDCLADLREIAARHFASFEQSGQAGPALVWRVERERLERFFFEEFLAQEVRRQQSQIPMYLEMPFGSEHTPAGLNPQPPELDLGHGEVLRFRGVIDRVDRLCGDRSAIFVIDYKGRRLPNLEPDGTGLGSAVQLPIYLLGARVALEPHGQFRRAGGEYISYDAGPKTRRSALEPPDAQSDQRLRQVLRTIAQGIHGGLFMQYTADGVCDYCDYAAVCMGVQHVITDRKRGDPVAQPFFEMKRFPSSSEK